ncbi:MAG: DUF4262 domain-containing protein [Pseudomonadota bacterium]
MVLGKSAAQSDADRRLFDDIEKYDCQVLSVANAVGEEGPCFSYCIGLATSLGAPELLVVGLNGKLSHSMINHYRDEIRNGRKFVAGTFDSGFLEGFDVLFIEANQTARKEFATWADWYHERTEFPLYQCIWPTTSGIWPWQAEASENFTRTQPILGNLPENMK